MENPDLEHTAIATHKVTTKSHLQTTVQLQAGYMTTTRNEISVLPVRRYASAAVARVGILAVIVID